MEEKIVKILRSIGLNKNEIIVYIDLVTHKPASANEIAKRTNVHRANTYDSLHKLVDKGFVKEIIEQDIKIFGALSPDKIIDYVKQQEQEIESIIPTLKNLVSQDDEEKEEIAVKKGLFSLRESLIELLELNKRIDIYGIPPEGLDVLGEGFLKEFHKQRIRKKIPMRMIFNQKDEILKLRDNLPHTEARCACIEHGSMAPVIICNDRVLDFVFSTQPTVIEIKNRKVAEAQKEYFQVLWNQAKK